jgi:hypothetical protein
MAGYVTITTQRVVPPDPIAVLAAIKTATGDPTAALIQSAPGVWRGKKADAWTAQQTADAQTIVDTTAALTPQLAAQRDVDRLSIAFRALVLTLVDEINVLRTRAGLPERTVEQAFTAIRNKAGTLT